MGKTSTTHQAVEGVFLLSDVWDVFNGTYEGGPLSASEEEEEATQGDGQQHSGPRPKWAGGKKLVGVEQEASERPTIVVDTDQIRSGARVYDDHLAQVEAAHTALDTVRVRATAFGHTRISGEVATAWETTRSSLAYLMQVLDVDVDDKQAALLGSADGFEIADEQAVRPFEKVTEQTYQGASGLPLGAGSQFGFSEP